MMASMSTKKNILEQSQKPPLHSRKRSLSLESDEEAPLPYIASANNENYYSATNIMKNTKEATRSFEEKERKRQKGYHLEEEEPQSVLLPYTHPHDDGTYAKSIYDHKFTTETAFIFTEPVFGTIQKEIDSSWYITLISFLFDIYQEQNLQFSTLIYSLHLLDQIIASFTIKRNSLYLVGISCLTLASKLEEIYPVDTTQLLENHSVLIASNITKEAIYQMEKRILQKLSYQLYFPTRYQFAIYYSYHLQFTNKQQSLLLFFILLSFLDFNLNYESMSSVAASAAYLVIQMTQGHRLQSDMKYYQHFQLITNYNENKLIDSLLRLRKLHEYRYELNSIKNILDTFNQDDNYEVNHLYPTIHYRDLVVYQFNLLPKNEKDYCFHEKALVSSNNNTNTGGNNNTKKEVVRATRIPKPTLPKSLLY